MNLNYQIDDWTENGEPLHLRLPSVIIRNLLFEPEIRYIGINDKFLVKISILEHKDYTITGERGKITHFHKTVEQCKEFVENVLEKKFDEQITLILKEANDGRYSEGIIKTQDGFTLLFHLYDASDNTHITQLDEKALQALEGTEITIT